MQGHATYGLWLQEPYLTGYSWTERGLYGLATWNVMLQSFGNYLGAMPQLHFEMKKATSSWLV